MCLNHSTGLNTCISLRMSAILLYTPRHILKKITSPIFIVILFYYLTVNFNQKLYDFCNCGVIEKQFNYNCS